MKPIYQQDKYFNITPLYTAIRYNHDDPDCSLNKSDALTVTRYPDKWIYKCHRCGDTGCRGVNGLPPDKIKELLKNKKGKKRGSHKVEYVSFPPDMTRVLPSSVQAWLSKYDLEHTSNLWYYSPGLNRAIFTICNYRGHIVGWTGRTMGKVKKKKNPKWYHIIRKDFDKPHILLQNNNFGQYKVCVYVEDVLSALKVSEAVGQSVCLLSAYVPKKLLLTKSGILNILWLDYDKGKYMLEKITEFNSLGFNTKFIWTDKDPKEYNLDFIKQKVKEKLKHDN